MKIKSTVVIVAVMCGALVNCAKKPQIISQSGYGLSISMSNALADGCSAVEMGNNFGMLVNDVLITLPQNNQHTEKLWEIVYGANPDFYSLTTWTNIQTHLRSASIQR